MLKKTNSVLKVALAIVMVVGALFFGASAKTYAYNSSNMPSGYRPITSQDVGKKFGVELETTILFSSQYTTDPVRWFPMVRITDSINREYYITSLDYNEERPYTYGFAVFDYWTESSSRYYYKELYFYDVMAEEGDWQEANPSYVVPSGYKLDLYYSPSNYSVIWVKDKGGGIVHYSTPFMSVENGSYGLDSKFSELPSLTYEGRYFVGWYYDIKYKERAMEGDSVSPKHIKNDGVSDYVILYGKWTVNYTDVWEDECRAIWTQEGYDNGFANGHAIGYQEGYAWAMENIGNESGGLFWLTSVMTSIGGLLAMEIFPSMSIGLLIFIPFAFGLLFWFLKLLKGGGD